MHHVQSYWIQGFFVDLIYPLVELVHCLYPPREHTHQEGCTISSNLSAPTAFANLNEQEGDLGVEGRNLRESSGSQPQG